jgi:DNA-binding transcriptional ArsR family regulator
MSVKGPDRGSKPGGRHGAERGTRSIHATDDGIRTSVLVFAALGDKTRLDLVVRLCAGGPLSITRLTAGADVTRQAITKHLNILAGAGLVRDIRVGRERRWEIEPRQLEEARYCLARISSQWDEALARLRIAVEGEDH